MDYRNFSEQGPKSNPGGAQWWNEKSKTNISGAIFQNIQTLARAQSNLNAMRGKFMRLYANAPLMGALGMSAYSPSGVTSNRITFNLVQSVVDTLTSKMAKNKPKPLFLTSGGDAKMQRKAKRLTQFNEGIYFQNQTYRLMAEGFRDAGVLGSTAIHDFDNHGSVGHERVYIQELLVDEAEAAGGNPRNLYRIKTVDRNVLEGFFPKSGAAIKRANNTDLMKAENRNTADLITVAEAWHLPSAPGAGDGKHVIAIEANNGTLIDEEWLRRTFPFAFFHNNKRMLGFWGQGCAERLSGIQLEINKLLWVIQRTMHLGGTAKLWLQQGSKINTDHITNDFLPIGWYVNTPPQYVTPPLVQPEIYQHLQTLKNSGYEQEGISMLSAQSKKPSGLDSGKALREYNDIESERFMTMGQAYEQFSLDIAYNTIQRAKSLYAEYGELNVKVPGSRFIETIDWKDVELEDDQFVMQCFPVSAFSDDPAARLQTVQEYMQAGLIDEQTGKKLLTLPDLQMVETLDGAMEERILSYLDKIIDEGEYTPPDEFMDLTLAGKLALQYYNLYINQGVEEERMDLIRQFMTSCKAVKDRAMEDQLPPPGALPPGAPAPQGMAPIPPGPGEIAGAPVLPPM